MAPVYLEGFGLVALEAAAHGTPAVVSDLACFAETLGDAALRVPVGDVGALADALLRIGGDDALRARLGAAARERAALYTWERAAAALHPLLAQAARVSFTIVTVLHDSAPELRRLLPSLREHLPPTRSSWSSTRARATTGPALAQAAGAEVIVLDGNPGFGAASNAGVAAARHAVDRPAQPRLRAARRRAGRAGRPRGGRRGPARPAADRGRRSPAAQRAPAARGAPTALVRAVLPTRALPQPHRARRPRRVGWAIAACLAAPTALLRRLGPFDPDAFLFYEDMDLCLRAHAAGVPTVLHPEVVVRHLGGRSTARAFGGEAFDLQARRRREVVGARLGRAALRSTTARRPLTFGLRAAVGRERGRNVAALRALRAARRMATAARR